MGLAAAVAGRRAGGGGGWDVCRAEVRSGAAPCAAHGVHALPMKSARAVACLGYLGAPLPANRTVCHTCVHTYTQLHSAFSVQVEFFEFRLNCSVSVMRSAP